MNALLRRYLVLVAMLAGQAASGQSDLDPQQFMQEKSVVILVCEKSFASTQKEAQALSRASGVPFSLREMVWDKKRGLIYPDNFSDESFAGSYVARRNDGEELTIERSDGYSGFARGYYMVVAGIYTDPKEAAAAVARFKRFAPSAYAKRTKIYMGCMH